MSVAALVAVLLVVGYFLVTTVADLFPFNDVRDATAHEKHIEVAINGPLMLVPAALLVTGMALNLSWFGWIAACWELVIAAGGLALWWLPYLVGVSVPWATVGSVSWKELHARTYAHTIIVLPRIADRPRPNLEHMVLHALFIAAATLCALSTVS